MGLDGFMVRTSVSRTQRTALSSGESAQGGPGSLQRASWVPPHVPRGAPRSRAPQATPRLGGLPTQRRGPTRSTAALCR